jgi:hypothetical protein
VPKKFNQKKGCLGAERSLTMSKFHAVGGSGNINKAIRKRAKFIVMAMALCLVFSFQYTFLLMGEDHESHVAQLANDHPAMVSHKIGTEPLEVSTQKLCVDVYALLWDH